MKAALHIPYFNYSQNTEEIAPTLVKIAQTAEDAGFSTISVMDHYFQIRGVGPYTDPMMEAYTVLSFIAAHTKKVTLGALVTGVVYRQPAFLIKQVTTLDVLSGGRAFFGIGAAWNDQETVALGFPFPPVKERFERLEEVLQIAKQMWARDTKPYRGSYYTLEEPLNSPQPLTKPHPPILIGGGGEQKTLKCVARYADACNLFYREGFDAVKHKLDVLQEHCKNEHRSYDEIEKTVMMPANIDPKTDTPEKVVERCKELAEIGVDKIFFMVRDMGKITPLVEIGEKILPQIASL